MNRALSIFLMVSAALVVSASLFLTACGDDDPAPVGGTTGGEDVAETTGEDIATTGVDDDATTTGDEGTTGEDTFTPPKAPESPAWFPDKANDAEHWVFSNKVSAPVRVVYDQVGTPHIYAENEKDGAWAQGYVTARHRMFQMHTLRMAASGRLAELLGDSALGGDVFLRTLKLRHTAEKMAERHKNVHPEAYGLMQAFADGVNAWIAEMDENAEKQPLEVALFGSVPEWTVADTTVIVRLQTWDLSFGGYLGAEDLFVLLSDLSEKHDGTPRAAVLEDLLDFTPPNAVATTDADQPAGKPGATAAKAKKWDIQKALASPLYKRIGKKTRQELRAMGDEIRAYPQRLFRGPNAHSWGSNNWVVSGQHTASGKPIVNNDPHLSLRNPSVFFQVHVNTKEGGGNSNISGVNFAGAPGIVLGHNDHIAWGATVFFSDVTDVYVEELSADKKSVLFNGKEVALESRDETFVYTLPSDGQCASAITGSMAHWNHTVEELEDFKCKATFEILDVPHHGPVIAASLPGMDAEDAVLLSWRWTGFEPTDDLIGVMGVNKATNFEEFKAALHDFQVGAQNWIYGDTEGNIGWYPSHDLPIREHIAACQATDGCTVEHPPFLPMPGDGTAEWKGTIPRDELPTLYNPSRGFLVTANADPTGTSFDGDPFNDGHYLGYLWTAGFRMKRAHDRVEAAVDAGGVTPADMASAQGDHYSNLGARLRPVLVAALEWAEQDGALWDASMAGPLELLKGWDLEAASGVTADAGSAEQKAASATAVFNTWVTYMTERALADEELLGFSDHFTIRLLLRMVESPESLATWDEATQQSILWDDMKTEDKTERMNEIMVLAFADAIEWLTASDRAAGGTASASPDDWRWGWLHTVVLKHNVLGTYDIPPASEHPHGFPRPGDNFCVDASHPGMTGRNFGYSHGPAIRHVMEMTSPITRRGAIPGGQEEDPRGGDDSPPHRLVGHYRDQMDMWVKNETPLIPFTTADVVGARQRALDIFPTFE